MASAASLTSMYSNLGKKIGLANDLSWMRSGRKDRVCRQIRSGKGEDGGLACGRLMQHKSDSMPDGELLWYGSG